MSGSADIGPETPALPRHTGIRAYCRSSYLVLTAIAIAVLGVFAPVVLVPYAFSDDYTVLYIADGLGSSPWFGDSVVRVVAAGARPISAGLAQLVFETAGSIDNLRYVRLITIVGIVGLAWLIHRALVKSSVDPPVAGLIAVSMCTVVGVQVYGFWTVLFPAPYAAIVAGIASQLASSSADEHATGRERNRRVAAAGGLLLVALWIYQPPAMFFWVFLAIALAGSLDEVERARRIVVAHAIAATAALALAYVSAKLILLLLGAEFAEDGRRQTLTHDPLGKVEWFAKEPLLSAANLVSVNRSVAVAFAVAIVTVVGITLELRRRSLRIVFWAGVAVALVPLTFLPNLIVAENLATYRSNATLSALLALYGSLGTIGIWIRVRNRVASRFGQRAVGAAQRLALGAAVAVVAMGAIIAARNVMTLVVLPQSTELKLLRQQVRALPDGVPRVGFVVTNWHEGFANRYISDEFIPSSSAWWVGEPATLLILREQGRLTDQSRPTVEVPTYEDAWFPPGQPIIDTRGLASFRDVTR